MRKSKFTTEQIAYCLTQAEAGVPMPALRRLKSQALGTSVPRCSRVPMYRDLSETELDAGQWWAALDSNQ